MPTEDPEGIESTPEAALPEGMLWLPKLPPRAKFVLEASSGRLAAIADENTGAVLVAIPQKKDLPDALIRVWALHALSQVGLDLDDFDALR